VDEEAKALADFQRAHELAPDNANIFAFMGLCHYHAGSNEEALADFNAALALDPQNKAALRGMQLLEEEGADSAQ
jgi:lipoprotein NlpI